MTPSLGATHKNLILQDIRPPGGVQVAQNVSTTVAGLCDQVDTTSGEAWRRDIAPAAGRLPVIGRLA